MLRARLFLIFAFWAVPTAALACGGTEASPYAAVTQIYVSTDGVTAPVAIQADRTLEAGDCPQTRSVRAWPGGSAMSGGPICFPTRPGKLSRCCWGTFATEDPPANIFARMLAVLERDRFYDVAAEQPLSSIQKGAAFEIAVLRCAPSPNVSTVSAMPEPTHDSQTTVLRIVVPLGAKPGAVLADDVVRLLEDITNAVYQSKWYGQDVY